MNKLFTKIGTAMVGIAMAVGVGVAVGRDGAKEVKAAYEAVTSLSDGDTVYITYKINTTVYEVTGFHSNNYLSVTAQTAGTLGTYSFTVEKSADNYYFKHGTDGYVAYTNSTTSSSGNNNLWYVSDKSTNGAAWTISFDDSDATVRNAWNTVRYMKGNANSGQARIAGYGSSGVITFYKVAASGFGVTYNPNGATSGTAPSDATPYQSGQSVTVAQNTGNLARIGYTFTGWNTSATGSGGTHYAADGTASFSITADTTLYAEWTAKTLTGISLNDAQPKVFWQNGTFSSSGLVVTANYSDGEPDTVSPDSITGYNMANPGNQTVTVTYKEETATYSIYVVELLNDMKGPSSSNDETYNTTSQGYTNEQVITSYTGTYFSVAFDKGTNENAPKYYTSGTAIRAYGGNTFTVSSTGTISSITITFGGSDGSNEITTDVGTYTNGSWSGSSSSVTFTIGGTTGNRRIRSIAATCNAQPNYKQQDIDAQAALMQFVDEFNKELGTTGTGNTGICKTDGSTDLEALATAWGNAESGLYKLFTDKRAGLSEAKQAVFDNMVKYATADADGDSFQKALSLYNHLVVNRGMSDFLKTVGGRGAATAPTEAIRLNNVSYNGGVIAIIAVASAISAIAVAGLLISKKRKED